MTVRELFINLVEAMAENGNEFLDKNVVCGVRDHAGISIDSVVIYDENIPDAKCFLIVGEEE